MTIVLGGPISPKELADIAFQTAADLFDEEGNLIPITDLPDHVASTITQVEVEVRDKLVKDEDGNPTVETVILKKIKRADKLAAPKEADAEGA